MLETRRLLILREVAVQGSLSAAARALNYTQPAISHQIRQLEQEVGTALVTRAGRGVQLTDAGRALAAHAETILARIDAAEQAVAEIAGLRGGRVRLVSFPSASATLVPQAVAGLKAMHPKVGVTLVEAEPPSSLQQLRAGECDLALAFDFPSFQTDDGEDFVKIPLLSDPMLAVLPATHPLAGIAELELDQLADEVWIAGCPRCRGHLMQLCASAGFTPQIAFTTDDNVAIQGLIAAGLGVGLVSALVLGAVHHPTVLARRLTMMPTRDVVAVVPGDMRRPPAIVAMLDALHRTSATLQDGLTAKSNGDNR